MNVFVVEDNAGIRDVLVDLLQRRGHDVRAFCDAESAKPVLESNAFHLGILDWGLPGMDGLELCRSYRHTAHGEDAVILVLTGRAEPDDLDEVVASGANDYITKPFKLDNLETRIAFAERQANLRLEERQREQSGVHTARAFRGLVESIPLITYIESGGEQRGMRYISPQVETLMGWTPDEVLASPSLWVELLHPDDLEPTLRAEREAHDAGERFSFEYRQRCRWGEYRWFRDDAEPILNEGGEIICWHGAISDITDRKESEAALIEQERRHRELSIAAERQANELRLLDCVRSEISREVELAAIFRSVVEATAEILGYPFVSLYLRQGDSLYLQHQFGYDDEAAINRVVREGEGIAGVVGFLGIPRLLNNAVDHPEFMAASDRVAHVICVPLFDDARVVGVFNIETAIEQPLTEDDLRQLQGVAEHVSAAISRSRLYSTVRESEHLLRSVLDDVREVVFQTDLEGRWTFLNQAWEQITGYSVDESLGRPVVDFTLIDYRDALTATVADFRDGHVQEVRGDFQLITASGEARWVEAHANRIEDGAAVTISGTLSDISERKRAEEALRISEERFRHLAMHDPLTALPNRALFMERLEEALATCGDADRALSVLYLDLDGFKLVNDSLGHDAGDNLLIQVADRLTKTLRVGDTVARLGGDEFALLLEDSPGFPIAEEVSRRILETFRTPFQLHGKAIVLGTSIGIAGHLGADGRANHLLRNADTALYVAKSSGHGQFAQYQPRMSAAVIARYQQENQLRRLIDDEAFELRYQPIHDLADGRIAGIETIVVWPEEAEIDTFHAQYNEILESSGLSSQLGQRVFRRACEDLALWLTDGSGMSHFLEVRLSPRQLRDGNLRSGIEQTLSQLRLDPARIRFSLNEPASATSDPEILSAMTHLRSLGVSLLLESLGSAHGTLRAMRALPIQAIRIDRDFIQDLGRDRASKEIARAVTALAQTLGMQVAAAGIENIDQLAHARSIQIDQGSGSYFAKPQTAVAIRALLRSSDPTPEHFEIESVELAYQSSR